MMSNLYVPDALLPSPTHVRTKFEIVTLVQPQEVSNGR